MPRVKRGVTARARHKKVLALAKGFRGRRGNVYRVAKEGGNEGWAICLP
jgi:large subunit ribosomal protein L20